MTNEDIVQLNNFEGFLSFKPTWAFQKYIRCPHQKIGLFTGNQSMKTASTAYQYVLRILSMHPVIKKNVTYWECEDGHVFSATTKGGEECTCGKELKKHQRSSKVFRFCSETLPGQSANIDDAGVSAEVRNTQYPEFKKWLPPHLIKKDITVRNPSMIITDPYDERDIMVDFVGYKQGASATAGVQRLSVWCDEEPPLDFYEEQLPRLMKENGDFILTLTPANYITWTYDELFEKASVFYRTKAICDYLETKDYRPEQVEHTDSNFDLAVIQAATDDNPTLDPKAIEALLGSIDDPDVLAIRRYGIFKQISGRIFKDFEYKVHYIDAEKYFPDGIPHNWTHARGIDFHPQTPWGCGMMSLSPENEAFIWGEMNPSPEKLTTREISREFARMGKDYKFTLNLVDPFADATKKDNITVRDDLNNAFRELKKNNVGAGAYWDTWDTKGEKGRDSIRERLKNAKQVKQPFDNKVDGQYTPTIWVLNTCPQMAKSLKQWRWEEYKTANIKHTKEAPNKPEQKWSHLPMVIEAIFKERAFRTRQKTGKRRSAPSYFQRRA